MVPAEHRVRLRSAFELLVAPTCLTIAIVTVYLGAARYGFSQDDFAGLARATGLLPRLSPPWRWLSHQAFYDAWHSMFGLTAQPYHLASIAAHVACALVLYFFLRRWVKFLPALAGSFFFGTHPLVFTAVYWIAAIGDALALFFTLITMLFATTHTRWRWASVPAFVLSLLAKESTLLLPLFLVAMHWLSPSRRNLSRTVLGTLVGISLGYGSWLYLLGGSGVPPNAEANVPYSAGWGHHVWQNLLTYAGWSVQMLEPFMHDFTDKIDPPVFSWGISLLLAWLAGLLSRSLRERGWHLAGLYVLLLLAPVLALRNHTYHYYAYAALPGVAWLLAAAFDATLKTPTRQRQTGHSPRRRTSSISFPGLIANGMIALLLGVLTVNGARLVRRIEFAPLGNGPLRSDAIVDRSLVVDRVARGVKTAALPPGSRLWLWSPARLVAGLPPEAPDTYWERNVRAATLDGLAIRVLFPQIREATFVRSLSPVPSDIYYGVFGTDGRTDVFTWAVLDSMLASQQ